MVVFQEPVGPVIKINHCPSFVISLYISGNSNLYKNVDFILSNIAEKRFIFNVGHGLTPECKIDNVKAVIKQVKNYRN